MLEIEVTSKESGKARVSPVGETEIRGGHPLSLMSTDRRSIMHPIQIFLSSILESVLKQASLIAQLVKNLPAMQETQVRFLGQEDPLEKEKATHSSMLAWRIPWKDEPGGLLSTGSQESDTT